MVRRLPGDFGFLNPPASSFFFLAIRLMHSGCSLAFRRETLTGGHPGFFPGLGPFQNVFPPMNFFPSNRASEFLWKKGLPWCYLPPLFLYSLSRSGSVLTLAVVTLHRLTTVSRIYCPLSIRPLRPASPPFFPDVRFTSPRIHFDQIHPRDEQIVPDFSCGHPQTPHSFILERTVGLVLAFKLHPFQIGG